MATVFEPPARPIPTEKMTYEEFLAWCDEDTHAEWVDGEVQMVSPVSYEHADLASFLDTILRFLVEAHDAGIVLTAPFQMRLRDVRRGREPDLIFVAKEHLDRLTRTYLDGPADIAVEIVSPESFARDRGDKFVEYETAGVREYWLIDPQRKQAEFYGLGADGRYHPLLIGGDGVFRSQVLDGFWLRVEWLWQEPLPKVAGVLKELNLI
jgi:Uma2 family endonuclease